jgi:hypothetical protein
MTTTLLTTGTVLEVTSCCECGVEFAAPARLLDTRREDHQNFYCPNGHTLHYPGKSKVERLQQQLDWANGRKTALADQLDASERSRRALRGVNTRMRNRVAAGMCPCCKRTFQNLAEHMSGQHPTFAASEDSNA